MKKNSLTIILIIIILLLLGYIIYDKFIGNKEINNNDSSEDVITITDNISLDYVKIYLTSNNEGYIVPLNNEEINNLQLGDNLKERLNTLYERAFYYDIYINNYKLKAFKVKLDNDITGIRKIEIEDNIYIVFIKENNTIGLFNYDEYYNLLYTKVEDNYNNLNNVKDISDNKIIYLDGSRSEFKMEQ